MESGQKSKIVVIGGGTGTFVALSGLKKYPVELTAIVTMMDSGGSSGKLRDELGVLPPGDIRQCLVALAKSSKLLRDMFNYRFEEGGLKGHNFGNIFLSTLAKTTGSMKKAISEVGKILRISGKVVPVTFSKSDLCVELTDGKVIIGETHIDELEKRERRARIKTAFLKPAVSANPDAISAILDANAVIIGPGDLYTSIIPNLLVRGVKRALQKSKARKIFVLNLMTKYGQTTNYKASDHIADLEKYVGRGVLDAVLINTKKPRREALDWYSDFEEYPLVDDLGDGRAMVMVRANLIKDVLLEKEKADTLKRSIIRHDPEKLAREIIKLTT
ncbi:YvcK family protein [Candidatus Microgenomates bacterium]|nr:YvcK family protein [Candidatus Microgenomates bacterium]